MQISQEMLDEFKEIHRKKTGEELDNGKAYEYIFLKKENPDLIDPDRKNPVLKSYHRNRDKVREENIREEKKKLKKKTRKHLNKADIRR